MNSNQTKEARLPRSMLHQTLGRVAPPPVQLEEIVADDGRMIDKQLELGMVIAKCRGMARAIGSRAQPVRNELKSS
jgi:hypothetical protein